MQGLLAMCGLQSRITRTWRALSARVEFRDEPGLVLGAYDEPARGGPEGTEPHPLGPVQGDLDQPGTGAIDKSGASPVVNSAKNAESERTTQFASVQRPGRCDGLARDRGLKRPSHANVDRRGTHRDARRFPTCAERGHKGPAGSIDPDRERPLVDHDPSSGKPQAHPERVLDQICGLSQPGPPLTLVRTGHQYRDDLLLVLTPEGTRVGGQRAECGSSPVAGERACGRPLAGGRGAGGIRSAAGRHSARSSGA